MKEIVALSNSNGGYLLIGVEDDKTITGCKNYDLQNIVESIYDRTIPNIFTKAETIRINDKDVIVIKVEKGMQLCGSYSIMGNTIYRQHMKMCCFYISVYFLFLGIMV